MNHSTSFSGIIRVTQTGEICIDNCTSDAEHLSAPTPEGYDRRMCRKLWGEFFPKEWIGKRGLLTVKLELK